MNNLTFKLRTPQKNNNQVKNLNMLQLKQQGKDNYLGLLVGQVNWNSLKPFETRYLTSDIRRATRIPLQIPAAKVVRAEAFREIVQAHGTKTFVPCDKSEEGAQDVKVDYIVKSLEFPQLTFVSKSFTCVVCFRGPFHGQRY